MDDLTVNATPAVIDTNFEAVRAQLETLLVDYDVVVTADRVKDAKKQAAELNKLASDIDRRRIDAVKEISKPIKAFETQAKELTALCKDARAKIVSQVEKFEAETLEEAREKLTALMFQTYSDLGIRDEFQAADIEPFVKLTALTAKGSITAAAAQQVRDAVKEKHNLQLRTDLRLSELENRCHKAGLHAPLSREHVEAILFAPDDVYESRLGSMIDVELVRQQKTEERAREAAEREQAVREQESQRSTDSAAEAPDFPEPDAPARPAPEAGAQVEPQPVSDARPGTHTVAFSIELHVNAPTRLPIDALQTMLLGKLEDAGIKDSLRSCEARILSVDGREAA